MNNLVMCLCCIAFIISKYAPKNEQGNAQRVNISFTCLPS